MSSPFTAGDVMDESASLLNDVAKKLFTYTAQLPYLKRANESLENLLIACGVSVQRRSGVTLTVPASTTTIDLGLNVNYPSDMLLPINLWEKTDAGSRFNLMTEQEWEPDITPTSELSLWSFRDNTIYTPGVTTQRLVKIDYWRQLSAVTSSGSNEEIGGSKTYLAAKTAELCARYIGQNGEVADSLLSIEVVPAQDLLERIYIKNSQGTRSRRRPFRRPGRTYST